MRRVSAFCRAKGARATIVFDGAPFRPELADQHLGAVTVRFPAQGLDADSLIRTILDAVDRPGDWIVVTSDKPVTPTPARAARGRSALASGTSSGVRRAARRAP